MAEENQLRNFTIKFFKELGASVQDSGDLLLVTQVPAKFQKFYGKNEPYSISFDSNKSSLSVEIVTSESYLLKTMRSYLDNTGESVLQRISYPLQADSLIKSKLVLRNCTISKINNDMKYKPIIKFTFQTTYKYLNDEDRLVNEVFIDGDKVVVPDLSNFKVESIKNKEFEISNLRESYESAKINVKGLISLRTDSIARQLDESLSKDVQRINAHHLQQVKETETQISKALAKNPSTDVSIYSSQKEQFISENNRQIANEEKKYSLRINTKLLTTTIILTPVYDFNVFFKNDKTTRLVLLSYDPLYDKFNPPICDLCRKSLNEVILCNGNHLVCRDCGAECEDCGKISCSQCLKQECAVTHRKICRQCGATCSKCRFFKNKRFMVKDSLGRYVMCRTCG